MSDCYILSSKASLLQISELNVVCDTHGINISSICSEGRTFIFIYIESQLKDPLYNKVAFSMCSILSGVVSNSSWFEFP